MSAAAAAPRSRGAAAGVGAQLLEPAAAAAATTAHQLLLAHHKGSGGWAGGGRVGGVRAVSHLLVVFASLALTGCALLLTVSIARMSLSFLLPPTSVRSAASASVNSSASPSASAWTPLAAVRSAAAASPSAAATPPPSPSSSPTFRSFLARVERSRPLVLPVCSGNRTEVERDFRLDALVDKGDGRLGKGREQTAHFAIIRLCAPSLAAPTPRASFRVYTTGESVTAAPPHSTVLLSGQDVVAASLRLPDAGRVELHCRLMALNLSASTLTDDYTQQQQQLVPRSPQRLWRDREVQQSPAPLLIPRSASPSSSPLPL